MNILVIEKDNINASEILFESDVITKTLYKKNLYVCFSSSFLLSHFH